MADKRRIIDIKAVALGVLTDTGGSLVIGAILAVIIVVGLAMNGIPKNQIEAYLHGPIVLILGMVIGFAFTILGGFVAGRVSKKFEILHGGIVGFIGILFGVLFWTTLPMWYIIVSLVGVVPLGMLCGRIAEVSRNRSFET
jgi:hypothetical protein